MSFLQSFPTRCDDLFGLHDDSFDGFDGVDGGSTITARRDFGTGAARP